MEEVLMIPQKDVGQLMQWYKGELTENALLNKGARLAAQKNRLLSDPNLPAAIVKAKTKPLSRELAKLTKQLRQFPSVGGEGGEVDDREEEGDLVAGRVEQWLKQMIKGSPSTPKPQIKRETTQETPPTSSPSVPRGKRKRLTRKQLRAELPFYGCPDTPGSTAQNGIERLTKEYKKRARAVERLKPLPGWEDWAQGKKLRRKLAYDEGR